MSFFGKNIRKLRQLKSYSQQEIAEIIGVKRGALGAYEEGRSEPKINTILKTANYFSIPLEELLTKELTVNDILNFNSKLTVDETLYRKAFPRIPLITKSNVQDYILHYDKPDFVDRMISIQLPLSGEEHFLGFQIQDLEMSYKDEGLFPKDIVVGKPLAVDSIKKEDQSKLCIIIANTALVRHVSRTESGFCLTANHPAIEKVILPAEDINQLWEVFAKFEILREM
jgi:transcriptional regulator with XRE-family HTH domain